MQRIYTILLALALFAPSCKRADQYAKLVNGQPYLITVPAADYETAYLVGDTASFSGRFFLGEPGSRIQIGNDTPHILSDVRSTDGVPNQYTHTPDTTDQIKFIITSSMGIGNAVPVSITAHGVTIAGPPLSIQQFQGSQQRTDTTLYVDSLTSWIPTDINFYANNNLPYVQNMNVSGNGILGFNNLTGVYTVNNGHVAQLLYPGSQLQENGATYTIQLFLGAAITFGGDSMYFSAQVSEDTPDTATAYIFRLCKMNIASGAVTTINRTEVQKGIGTANEAGGPYQGTLSSLKVVAADLKTDVNGSLYFVNYYAPSRTDYDHTANWYNGDGIDWGIPTAITGFAGDAHTYQNICRMAGNGQATSLFYQSGSLYTIPGYPLAETSDYLISPDGGSAVVCTQITYVPITLYSMAYVNLAQNAILASTPDAASVTLRFYSYDTSSITGYNFNPTGGPLNQISVNGGLGFFLQGSVLSQYLLLSDGYLLNEYDYDASLLAISIPNKSSYCYAGTEAGLNDSPFGGLPPPAVQDQTTGRAKYIDFPQPTFFADGVDKQGAVYYYSGYYMNYATGLSFYKLYSKK